VPPYILDPRPGCNATDSRYFVRLPAGVFGAAAAAAGTAELSMYYGNPALTFASEDSADPQDVFDLFEDFNVGLGAFAPAAVCTAAATATAATAAASTGAVSTPASDVGFRFAAGTGGDVFEGAGALTAGAYTRPLFGLT
jgi:hypothetical protein